MTKKDYILISHVLCDARETLFPNNAAWVAIVNRMGDALMLDNPKFDRERFLDACKGIK